MFFYCVMACFMKDTIPYKYFENLIPTMNQNCELGIKELRLGLHRMRLENAVYETRDVIELAILEVLLRSQTFCVTEEDMLSQVWSYLSTSVLYCTPNLKARFTQTLREIVHITTRTESHVIYVRRTVHNLDMIYLRSEILDLIALYAERFRYQNDSMINNCEREQFRLSIACTKILIYAEQNVAKCAAATLQRSVNWIQNKMSKITDNLNSLLEFPPSSWSTETVLKLHMIYTAMQTRKSSMFKINIPLPTFATATYPPVESTYSWRPKLSRFCRMTLPNFHWLKVLGY